MHRHLDLLLHRHSRLNPHLYTPILRGSEGKRAKKRSTEKSKHLLEQSRMDLGTTSQPSTATSPGDSDCQVTRRDG